MNGRLSPRWTVFRAEFVASAEFMVWRIVSDTNTVGQGFQGILTAVFDG